MLRTASTVKHATSKTSLRTSTGSHQRGEGVQPTRACEQTTYSIHTKHSDYIQYSSRQDARLGIDTPQLEGRTSLEIVCGGVALFASSSSTYSNVLRVDWNCKMITKLMTKFFKSDSCLNFRISRSDHM